MDRDKQAPRRSDSKNPLNVSSDKIEETRARVKGDTSPEALKESLVMSRKLVSSPGTSGQMTETDFTIEETRRQVDSTENVGREGLEERSYEKLQEMRGESNPASNSQRTESDTTPLGLSENAKWVRKHFKGPLALAMRDIIAKKPSDPIDFLAAWLLNYRNVQERLQLKQKQDRELIEERTRIHQFLSESSLKNEENVDIKTSDYDEETYEGDEENVDSNFQNYIE